MKVDVICPLYKGKEYIEQLYENIIKQKNVDINEIHFILSDTFDESENILKNLDVKYSKINVKDFSHSRTREEAINNSKSDIIVLITQDIEITNENWLKNLITPIENGKVSATYSRQISKFNNIEKYTREFNYPEKSFIKSRNDIDKMGLKTFFSSDASSAILRKDFVELNGYDGKDLPTNEDMYFSYKLIMNNKKIMYVADSVIYHSHNFSLKQIYDRYKLTGIFFKENSYLNEYKANKAGASLATYILKRIIKDKKIKLLFRYPFDMGARFIGMKVGKLNGKN